MSDEIKNKLCVCLDFGGASCTYIETDGSHIDQESEITSWIVNLGLARESLLDWATAHLSVLFDGFLDNPEKFHSIKAIGIYGPSVFEVSGGSPLISHFSIYLEVEASDVLCEDDLEDIFHIIIPVIKYDKVIVAFTEFHEYSALLEEPREGAREINVVWSQA